MFARKLQPSEYWRANLNMAIAFENSFEYEKEREKAQTAVPSPLEEFYAAFLSEDEPPVASVIINKKQVRFDGHIVKMGGVGGVATLPAHRRGGAIRACMDLALRDMYQEGYALSHLYPFSTSYYRQFGFAPAGKTIQWKIRLSDLKRLPEVGGSVRQLMPGDDLTVLLDLYNHMYGNINFSCLRKVFNKRLEGDTPLAEKQWIFVWLDETGVPGGFLVASRIENTLNCLTNFAQKNALIAPDTKALIGLLRFVSTVFLANFEFIEFGLPDHLDLSWLLPELSGMDCRAILNGMTRAVNVELLLKFCRCRGKGRLILKVSDSIISENNDTFLLEFAPDRENQVNQVNAPADIELDVGNLSALLGGSRDAGSLVMTPDIRIKTPDLDFSQVFYRKPCHILDLF